MLTFYNLIIHSGAIKLTSLGIDYDPKQQTCDNTCAKCNLKTINCIYIYIYIFIHILSWVLFTPNKHHPTPSNPGPSMVFQTHLVWGAECPTGSRPLENPEACEIAAEVLKLTCPVARENDNGSKDANMRCFFMRFFWGGFRVNWFFLTCCFPTLPIKSWLIINWLEPKRWFVLSYLKTSGWWNVTIWPDILSMEKMRPNRSMWRISHLS